MHSPGPAPWPQLQSEPDAGHVIAFAGGLEHAGHPISAGTRYILAVFVYCALNESGRETGYSLAAVEGAVDEARAE